jgi:serine/threonine-protein kinase
MFSLRFLGGASIDGTDAPVTGPAAQRHRLALVALLVGARPEGMSRDKLIGYLWSERDAAHARNLLKQGVHAVRRTFGDDAILAAGDELRLNPSSIRSDVAEFEAALARGDHERAVGLYRGPFLDGFFLRDAPEFERWVDRERAHLADAYAKALEALAVAAERRGDSRRAAEWWKMMAAHDRYDSRVALRLMQALDVTGNRAAALQYAEIHERMLDEDLGMSPAPELVVLKERLRREPVARPSVSDEERDSRTSLTLPAADDAVVQGEDGQPSSRIIDPPNASTTPTSGRARGVFAGRTARFATAGLLGIAGFVLIARLATTRLDRATHAPVAAAQAKAIAVLPFINLSRDPNEQYFSDGLTEEIIAVLSQVRALRVVARTSAFAFKGDDRDIREIGRTLGAGVLLEGSVRTDGDRVRVTAQLINAADGLHLWSETYERQVTDLFAIQSDLAVRITRALEAELTPEDRTRLERKPTENSEAHALYLKGRYFSNRRTRAGFDKANEYFERAIAADSGYVAAYAGLAMAYSLQGFSGYLLPQDAKERMRIAALKAVALDDDNAEAHAALGAYLNAYEWNSETSEREYQRAIALDPGYGAARHLYGNLLRVTGRHEEAVMQKRVALELDPLVPAMSEGLGVSLLEAGRRQEALEHIHNAIELDSTYWRAYASLGAYYESTGEFDAAVRAHQRAVVLAGANVSADVGLARSLALAGRRDEARRILTELQAEASRSEIYAPGVATVLLALDDVDGALEWLERSYGQRHPDLRFISRPGGFDRLRENPRFRDLAERVGVRW